MKKLVLLFLLTNVVFSISAQENVFSYTVSEKIVTKNESNTKAVNVNRVLLDQKMSDNSNIFFLRLPLINEDFLNVNLQRFSVLSSDHNLIIETSNGQQSEEYIPEFQSYYILHDGNSIGTFLCFENSIVISYKHNNRQFELNKIDNEFLLFDVNDCVMDNTFSCEVEEKMERIDVEENVPESSFTTPKCLELAIEIDNYTRNTFNSNTTTTNWAHAILAGVSQVYASEVNLNIAIVTTIIWETTDPYASYINNASNMLTALRNHWTSNNGAINRDLVHLLTKRSNTGTGGIAYRDVLCSNSWGYAFSSDLNNTTNFNFPNPSYTWNLMVCSHEIGHNIESHHTHWCGWPGGPIDNCADVEGSCANNPTAQVGTIMSYCHTTSSGSLIDFHSIVVNNALNPGINGASCLTTCTFYGCTDPNATNYDPNATVDDGSCTYSPPVLTAITTNISCFGLSDGAIDLSVIGGLSPYTYVWSNGLFSQDLSGLSSGTYIVVVTDALGQTVTASYNISEPVVLSATFIVNNTSGPGMSNGSITANPSGGTPPYSYYWAGSSDQTQSIYNLSAGSYTSYILDANGCYITTVLTIIDDTPVPLSISSVVTDVSCYGGSDGSIDITVSGGSLPYTYSWSDGSTSEDLSNLSAGNYSVIVTDNINQSITSQLSVNEPSAFSFSYNITNESSTGSNDGAIDLTVSGGVAPYDFYWTSGQTTEDISGLAAGTYIVYVGYNNWSCYTTDTVVISLASSIIYGCTDSNALNYNVTATQDDGSCLYSCDSITGVFVSDIIHERATFNWDNMNSSICNVDQIRFRYRKLGTNSWNIKTMGSPTGSGCNTANISKLVLGLDPSSTYEYQFKIWYCGNSTINWHAAGTFSTLSPCPNVNNFGATVVNNTKVQFDWTLNGVYDFVRIKLREDVSNSSWFNAGGFGVNYPTITKDKNGLIPGQSYRAQARTWCSPNGGAYRSDSWTPLIFWTQTAGSGNRIVAPSERRIVKITDVLGREVNPKKVIDNTTLFYIYSDGTVEKKIIINN